MTQISQNSLIALRSESRQRHHSTSSIDLCKKRSEKSLDGVNNNHIYHMYIHIYERINHCLVYTTTTT